VTVERIDHISLAPVAARTGSRGGSHDERIIFWRLAMRASGMAEMERSYPVGVPWRHWRRRSSRRRSRPASGSRRELLAGLPKHALDGRFRHAELIGDLLVEQPLRQHHQPRTCCGVSVTSRFAQGAPCRRSSGRVEIGVRGTQIASITYDGVAQRSDAEKLGMKPEAPKSSERRIVPSSLADTRPPEWPDNARADRSGRRTRVPDGEIEQDQIDVGIPFSRAVRSSNDPASLTTADATTLTTA